MIRTVTPSTPYASTPIVADMNSTSYTLLPKYGLREYFEVNFHWIKKVRFVEV
jgi:hypothetical protein